MTQNQNQNQNQDQNQNQNQNQDQNQNQTRFFVGLGSNQGDRIALLRAACHALGHLPSTHLVAASSIWETRPVGPGTAPFLNAALTLDSALEAHALLAELVTLEQRAGRVRTLRWGDRTLDLDLLCGRRQGRELVVTTATLTLPHPHMAERDFVLTPLLELAAELELGGRPCAELLAALSVGERTILRRVDLLIPL